MDMDYESTRVQISSCFLFLLGFLLDTVSTHILVQKLGFSEGNRLIRVMMDSYGLLGLIGVKVAILVFIVTIAFASEEYKRILVVSLSMGGILWLIAGVANVSLLV